MHAATTQRAPARKRNRKRKRRNVSSDESSDSADSSSDLDVAPGPLPVKKPSLNPTPKPVTEESSSSSSEPDSDSEVDVPVELSASAVGRPHTGDYDRPQVRAKSASPPLPSTATPSFITAKFSASEQHTPREQALREKFRKFWMSSVADGFVDDLNEIRKEPNLTASRLGLLIDSLATGSDIYTSKCGPDRNVVNEMEVVLMDR